MVVEDSLDKGTSRKGIESLMHLNGRFLVGLVSRFVTGKEEEEEEDEERTKRREKRGKGDFIYPLSRLPLFLDLLHRSCFFPFTLHPLHPSILPSFLPTVRYHTVLV